MTSGTNTLFVYGTLMSSSTTVMGSAERERLAREARRLDLATTMGRLFDLGRYPGLVLSDCSAEVVHGEAWELADPDRSFRWLDAYEGIVPGNHLCNPYARVVRPVTLQSGLALDANLYAWLRDTAGKPLLSDGRWR